MSRTAVIFFLFIALIAFTTAFAGCSGSEDADKNGDDDFDGDLQSETETEAETTKISPPQCAADKACAIPIVNAHRGLCGTEPENTIAAFLECEKFGVPMLEIDVRRTLDGRLVLMHDSNVDRTTDGETRFPGKTDVDKLTLAEFKTLVIDDERCKTDPDSQPDRCHPATFEELLSRSSPNTLLFIDFKAGDAGEFANVVLTAGAGGRVIFFDSELPRLRAYRAVIANGLVMPRANGAESYDALLDSANDDLNLLWIHGDPGDAAVVEPKLKKRGIRLYFNLFTLSDLSFASAALTEDPEKKAAAENKAKAAIDAAILSGGDGFGAQFAVETSAYLYPNGFGAGR